jgi:sugar/nucleoside kinase (ribokinase family)
VSALVLPRHELHSPTLLSPPVPDARGDTVVQVRGLFVGLATLDLVQRVHRRPEVDEKVVARRSDLAAGGPAAAAAVTFSALGGYATLLSALGPGPIGRLVAADLHGAGVHTVDAWAGGADLSISAITVLDGTGERSVVSRNAEDLVVAVPADLPALLSDVDVVLLDGHYPELAVAVARAAHAAGIPVVLDGGSSKPVYAELVPLADAMVCSASFDGLPDEFDAVAAEALAAGARLVAMTAGGAPVRWRTREASGAIEVPSITVCDTLGAGDVLHGAFAFARGQGVTDPERSDPRLHELATSWLPRAAGERAARVPPAAPPDRSAGLAGSAGPAVCPR